MNQKGFSQLILMVIVGAVLVLGGGGFWYYKQSTDTKIESNVVVEPSVQTVAKIAKALGVPMEELIK